ncbi:MAG: hypothetical protein KAY32_17130 [Candidatus Eisenbacteria sp.]|nr:hypothetical protein [Candidatus Eisenbacteria bacterium]
MGHASMQEAARITEALLAMPVGTEATMNGRRVRRDDADGLETWVVDGRRHGYFLAVEAVTGRTTEELAAWLRQRLEQ